MKLLKENGINLRALSIADTKDFGILRMIANDTDKTVEVLRKASYVVADTEVVVLDILGSDNVNIEYLYSFLGKSDKSVSFVIRVDDNDNASAALEKGGIIQLTENDISEM